MSWIHLQVYPEGNQSNNNQFLASATGTISAIDGLKSWKKFFFCRCIRRCCIVTQQFVWNSKFQIWWLISSFPHSNCHFETYILHFQTPTSQTLGPQCLADRTAGQHHHAFGWGEDPGVPDRCWHRGAGGWWGDQGWAHHHQSQRRRLWSGRMPWIQKSGLRMLQGVPTVFPRQWLYNMVIIIIGYKPNYITFNYYTANCGHHFCTLWHGRCLAGREGVHPAGYEPRLRLLRLRLLVLHCSAQLRSEEDAWTEKRVVSFGWCKPIQIPHLKRAGWSLSLPGHF